MVQATPSHLIEAIRDPPDIDHRLQSLKQLKNSIVGHEQRKELLVHHGGLEPLTDILREAAKLKDADNRRSSQAKGNGIPGSSTWTREDECGLQATMILGSLAAGGAPYVPPMLAAGTVRHLLAALRCRDAPKLVTATLQAVQNFATSWSAAMESGSVSDFTRLGMLQEEDVGALMRILKQAPSRHAAQQLTLACDIIALSAQGPCDDQIRSRLADSGMLDTLTALLASHTVHNKLIDYRSDTSHLLPNPSPAAVPSILSAITAIVSGSTYRAHRFVLSDAVKDLFMNFAPGEGDLRYMMGARHGMPNGEGSLLPPLHIPAYKSVTFGGASHNWPVLGGMHKSAGQGAAANTTGANMDHANAVCGWLLFFVRSFAGRDRIKALRLLALVNEAIELDVSSASAKSELAQKTKERERQLCLLAVPLAVRLVMDASEDKSNGNPRELQELIEVKEQACEVLALLIRGNKELQITAVDAGAIKAFCPLLKKSFDNVPLAKPMWSAKPTLADQSDIPETHRLGDKGLPKEIIHAMRCRKNALDTLAAIAEREDPHRKAIVESGVVTCIIDSLKPFAANLKASIKLNKGQLSAKDGNTPAVILAACNAAKSISRSVSLLRTSLVDAGIAKPTFDLLKHPEHEVQLSATNVCANLLHDCSPMREDLVAEGVVRTLCDHARRSSPSLRISSLCALKNLMLHAPKDLKMSTLEELGTGWLVSTLAGEQRDTSFSSNGGGGVSVGLSTSNAAGEQVDLLNPSSMDVDVDDTFEHSDNLEDDDDEVDGEVMYEEPSNTHYQSSQLRSTIQPPTSDFDSVKYLSAVHELEKDPALQARRNDIATQEQALDVLRNFTNGEDCASCVDYLFHEIGHQKLFDIITSKFAPLPPTSRPHNPPASAHRPPYHPTEVILSTVHLLVHLANGSPAHKQLLISQSTLLHAWLPHFNHPDRSVRVMCVWGVNSLTWVEDERDRASARARAVELRATGIEAAVRSLAVDSDLDVRERVRTAINHLEAL